MAKRKLKCTHADTEDTLILSKTRRYNNATLLKEAVLIQNCRNCKEEQNFYVAGGILLDDCFYKFEQKIKAPE